jgi:hypothetical protein
MNNNQLNNNEPINNNINYLRNNIILFEEFSNLINGHLMNINIVRNLYNDIRNVLNNGVYGRNIYNLVDDMKEQNWTTDKIRMLLKSLHYIARIRNNVNYIQEIDECISNLISYLDVPPLLVNNVPRPPPPPVLERNNAVIPYDEDNFNNMNPILTINSIYNNGCIFDRIYNYPRQLDIIRM